MQQDAHLERAASADPDERRMAARELLQFPFTDPIRHSLLELIGDTDWRVRRSAVDALTDFNKDDLIPDLLAALYDQANAGRRNAAIEILRSYGRRIQPYLSAHLKAEDADVRMFLVTLIGDMREASHLAFVSECLESPEPNLVSAAILALGKIGAPGSSQTLIPFLTGENLWYRIQAIEAAGEMQDETLLPHLLHWIDSEYCRPAVLKALGRFHHRDAYHALIASLAENPRDGAALRSLMDSVQEPAPLLSKKEDQNLIRQLCSELLCPDSIPRELQQYLKLNFEEPSESAATFDDLRRFETDRKEVSSDPWVRAAAYRNLPVEQRSVDLLRTKLPSENPICKLAIFEWLRSASYPDAAELLSGFLGDSDPVIRASACECLANTSFSSLETHLNDLLNDPDWKVRAAAVRSLSFLQPAYLVPRLFAILEKDDDPSVRTETLKLLQKAPTKMPPPIVFEFLQDERLADSAAKYLYAIASQKEEILNLCQSMRPAVRRIVAQILH